MHYRTGNRSRILCCLRILAAAVLILLSVTAQGGFSVFAAPGEITNASDGAAENGWLSVRGTQLVNEKGQAVVLHGMSSHGLQWFSQFTTADAIGATAAYGANLFRIAVYTVQGGYLSRRSAMLKKLYRAVDAAISRNMYVIIDWHILKDGNPKKHQKAAKDFFRKVSRRYGKTPNVIYEICNEPNKKGTWKRIRSYANAVIPVIRKNAPSSVILVGTPTWSQDVDTAAGSPLPYPNLMYTCHFYAGTHGEWLRGKVREALGRGLPVFISEWGSSRASGSGGVYTEEADRWISFMEQHKLSWTNWSFCNKAESSAALDAKANPEDGLTPEELSASGRYVFSRF
jgi:endoglucanase